MARSIVNDLISDIMLDLWPRSNAAKCDFGIDSKLHYEALYYPIRSGEITAEKLDAVLGDGPAITNLVNSCDSNPHKGIVFVTAWDYI
jgi:hypothetical protein